MVTKDKSTLPLTEKELDRIQPEITKIMTGLNGKEKSMILRQCLEKYKEDLKIKNKI